MLIFCTPLQAESAKRRKSAGSAAAAGQPSNQAANSARELTAVGSRANPETEQLDLTSLRVRNSRMVQRSCKHGGSGYAIMCTSF